MSSQGAMDLLLPGFGALGTDWIHSRRLHARIPRRASDRSDGANNDLRYFTGDLSFPRPKVA
jgi:hypothetical protein